MSIFDNFKSNKQGNSKHNSSSKTSSSRSSNKSVSKNSAKAKSNLTKKVLDETKKSLSRRELKENLEILEMAELGYDDGMESDYRGVALKNTKSNYGWYTCPKCGRKFRASDMDADHIIPKSKGGTNDRYNLQMLCYQCNRSKQADTSDTYEDLARRRDEISRQRNEDYAFINILSKQMKEKDPK